MNSKSILRAAIIVSLYGSFLLGCSSPEGSDNGNSAEQETRIEPVRVYEVAYQDISRSVTYNANLQAFREVHLVPASPGRISSIYVEPGQRVSEGQLLFEMDQTQYNQALLQLQSIETDYRRLDTLRKIGSVSQQQYDQIRTQYELSSSNVNFLKENTKILAPFQGIISGKYFENGEMYSGAPNTAVGKAAILSLVQTNRLKAVVNVAERYYPYVKAGMQVFIGSDLYPEELFSGSIITVYPVIDHLSRTFKIEISVPNPQEMLRPGMFARATLELDQEQAFVVPSITVLKLQGSNERYVFLEDNGRAKRVSVQLGDRFDDMVEVISDDIHAGDKLIIAGQSRLLDGMAVQVIQ